MRSFSEWVQWRVRRIPRKLRLAKPRAIWLYRDVRNELRILWDLRLRQRPIEDVTRYERRIDSQNGEDGILEAIFAKIGTTNKYFVEFGSGNASECNTVYLSRWSRWSGLWMDATNIDAQGRVKQERVTADNIQGLFAKYRVPKAFDLLCIDIDGNDYWVWKAITDYDPRVVVIEYNGTIPPDVSKTIPYDPSFQWDRATDYFGASLLALQKLGHEKGYALVGCDSTGANAFFVKRSLVGHRFLVRDVQGVYRPLTWPDGERPSPHPDRVMIEV